MKRPNISSKAQREYERVTAQKREAIPSALPGAPTQGFEFFDSPAYVPRPEDRVPRDAPSVSRLAYIINQMRIFGHHLPGMIRGINSSFSTLAPYVKELDAQGELTPPADSRAATYPNHALWEELCEVAWARHRLKLGFTDLPDEVVFAGHSVLFRHALVAIQEMDEANMATAPSYRASNEVIGVYKTLGLAVNDLAAWLRARRVRCQSNHPLGGLTSTVPLAVKAGLGWRGHHGMLITPWWGPRQRIAPIFLEEPVFARTDSDEHRWIERFCETCHLCERECPAGAILPVKQVGETIIPGLGPTVTCIDREKCFPYFEATLGCGRCIAVCPFGRGKERYARLKRSVTER